MKCVVDTEDEKRIDDCVGLRYVDLMLIRHHCIIDVGVFFSKKLAKIIW